VEPETLTTNDDTHTRAVWSLFAAFDVRSGSSTDDDDDDVVVTYPFYAPPRDGKEVEVWGDFPTLFSPLLVDVVGHFQGSPLGRQTGRYSKCILRPPPPPPATNGASHILSSVVHTAPKDRHERVVFGRAEFPYGREKMETIYDPSPREKGR